MTLLSGFAMALGGSLLGLGLVFFLRYWLGRDADRSTPGLRQADARGEKWRGGGRWLTRRNYIAAILLLIAGIGGWLVFRAPVVAPPGVSTSKEAPAAKFGPGAAGGELAPLVSRLKERLATEPKNGEGWLLLARAYGQLHQYAEADAAYRQAAQLLAPDAVVLADWADAHVMAQQRQWDAEARALVARALKADSRHVKALALAGSEAFERQDYGGAIAFWQRMKAAPAASPMEQRLADANIEEARRVMGVKP